MAITDLTGTQWRFHDYITIPDFGYSPNNHGSKHFVISGSITNGTYTSTSDSTFTGIGFDCQTAEFPSNVYIFGLGSTSTQRPSFMNSSIRNQLGTTKWSFRSPFVSNVGAPILTITGGSDVTNIIIINWLQTNADQILPTKILTVTYDGVDIIDSIEVREDVIVAYDNRTIVTVSDGTKTLKCNGKVMKSDVALGGKTLKCSGKRMVSDVVVKVDG